jgi:hypothetical protein
VTGATPKSSRPLLKCSSVWHIPDAVTRTRTSPASGSRLSSSSNRNGCPGPWYLTAFIINYCTSEAGRHALHLVLSAARSEDREGKVQGTALV